MDGHELKIGEFSQLGQVSVRMLRHYDKLELLKPARLDPFTGYRYYTLEQLPRLNRILALNDLGFTLQQVGELLESDLTVEQLRGMFIARQKELERELLAGTTRLHQVAVRLNQIEHEDKSLDDYEIVVKSVPAFVVAGIRSIVPTADVVGQYCDAQFAELYAWLSAHGMRPDGPTINFYHMLEYRENDVDMESAVILEGDVPPLPAAGDIRVRETQAVTHMASLIQPMSFQHLAGDILTLLKWVVANDYQFTGPVREIHLFGDPLSIEPHEQKIMELQVPVARMSTDD